MRPSKPNLSPTQRDKIQELLSQAILRENIPRVHTLLSQGAAPSGRAGRFKRTPLMDACSMLNVNLIELFLPFNDVNAIDNDGQSALHFLVGRLSFDVFLGPIAPNLSVILPADWRRALNLLLSAGSSGAGGAGSAGSALTKAASSWTSSLVEFSEIARALPPSDFSALDAHWHSPYSAALGSLDANGAARAKALLKIDLLRSAALPACPPQHGSLSHLAAWHGQTEFLVEISTLADFGARNLHGRTPLMAAMDPARKHVPSCIEFLLAHGGDAQAVDHNGCDALMLFIERRGRVDALTEDPRLKKAIASLVLSSNLWARDFLGESALEKARDRKMHELARLILRTRLKLVAPASPCVLPAALSPSNVERLQELLFQAIEFGETSLAKKFLRQGACPRRPLGKKLDVFKRGYDSGETPLITAAISLSLEMIQLLAPLSNLADVDSYGETALLARLRSTKIRSATDLDAMRALFSPEVARIANHAGMTPLMAATASINFWPSAIDILGPASDWMALDAEGNNVLAAKLLRMSSVTDSLAIWDAHPNPGWLASCSNQAGETIAHLAALRGFESLLAAIAPQADFAATTASGMTPLLSACHERGGFVGFARAVKSLAPWSDCFAVDLNGCDALMLAIETAPSEDDVFLAQIQELLGRVDLHARDFLGESALDKALCRQFSRAACIIRARMAIFEERDELANAAPLSSASARSAARI